MNLLIIGAGEYGQLVKELAQICGYKKIDFLDDYSELAIGKIHDSYKYVKEYTDFIVAVGNPIVRRNMIETLENSFHLVTLIHPSAVISDTAQIEAGCVIEAHTVIHTATYVGKSCFVNAGAVVNHNSKVEAYSQIDCNAVVAARAKVPTGTKVISCTMWNGTGEK